MRRMNVKSLFICVLSGVMLLGSPLSVKAEAKETTGSWEETKRTLYDSEGKVTLELQSGYNEVGLVVQEIEYKGGEFDYWNEYELTELGSKTKELHYDEEGNLLDYCTYEYKKGTSTDSNAIYYGTDDYTVIECRYNPQDQLMERVEYTATEFTKYDATGEIKETGNFYGQGLRSVKIDGIGWVYFASRKGCYTSYQLNEYDESGNITKRSYYYGDGTLEHTEVLEKKSNSQTDNSTNGTTQNQTYTEEYDENGNKIKETDYDKDGNIEWMITLEYDEYGNLIKETNYEADGTVYDTFVFEYKFRKNGEKLLIGQADETADEEQPEVNANVPAGYVDNSGSPMEIEGLDLAWNEANGKSYWYENGVKQGTYYDTNGVMGDGTIRGREICDVASDGWYWLDSVYDGAKAEGKEVWIPYIYQDEADWDDAKMVQIASESDPGMEALVLDCIRNKTGKWVRYDEQGKMLKGWVKIEGALAEKYTDQVGNVYYYDKRTGLMARGKVTIEGVEHYFDDITGVLVY